jgi:hypothetical protein
MQVMNNAMIRGKALGSACLKDFVKDLVKVLWKLKIFVKIEVRSAIIVVITKVNVFDRIMAKELQLFSR